MTEKLNRREREIMDIVFARGRCSAQEVVQALGDGTSNSAVRTMLGILESKGFLQHAQEGKRFLYSPVQSPASAGKQALRRAMDTFFGSSLSRTVAALMDTGRKMDEEELARLEALIERARKEGK